MNAWRRCSPATCADQRYDRRGVDAAAERRADRHVAAQAQADRVQQQLAQTLDRVLIARRGLDQRGLPPAPDRAVTVDVAQQMGAGQPVHRGEEAVLDRWHDTPAPGTAPGASARGAARWGATVSSARTSEAKISCPAVVRPEQRLLAERVARGVSDRSRSSQTAKANMPLTRVQRALSPLSPRVQQHLAVALGDERVTEAAQLVAQLAVVVDLAVEHEVQRTQVQRLIRARVEVDDREPAKGQSGRLVAPRRLRVGPAVRHRRGHAIERRGRRCAGADDPRYPTHSWSIIGNAPASRLGHSYRRLRANACS